MADSSPKHADFNWPPTDEELAECLYSGPPDEQLPQRGVEVFQETVPDETDFQAEATMPTGLLAPLETSARPLETPAPPPAAGRTHDISLNGFEPEASTNTSSKSWDVEFDRHPAEARKSEWAAEITHLQALIEALTDGVE